VTFYYLIVLHHLMGYMVFQYQNALGYSARLQDDSNKRRNEHTIALAKISAFIKEGDFYEATDLLEEQVHMNADNLSLNSQYFELLLSTKNRSKLTTFLPKYFKLLDNQTRHDLISRNYKRMVLKIPEFEIADPALKLHISQACFDLNDPKVAIKLLNGIQKKHPEFKDLIPALALLADALDEYPKYAVHATACRKMISRLSNSQ
ncbi:MAG: hypothetical protein ACSHWU_05710, partial [Marinicella sp.]